MREYQSLSHTRWNCKYHVVFIPKRRRKVMFGQLRKHLGTIFHELAKQKGCGIIERHLMADHVHLCLSIQPKFAVSNVVGLSKVKVRFRLPGRFEGRPKTSQAKISGQEDSLFRQWALTKRWSEVTYESENAKMSVSNS